MIGAIYTRPSDFVAATVAAHFAPVADEFRPHIERALPHLSFRDVAWRIRWCVFGTIGALLTDESAPFERTSNDLIDELVRTLAAALTADTDGCTYPLRVRAQLSPAVPGNTGPKTLGTSSPTDKSFRVFLFEEVVVDSPVERTAGRLASWLTAGEGEAAAADAMAAGGRVLARAGFAGLSKTVEVSTLEPQLRGDVTVIALRWSATGAFGDLFPTLDANLEISAAGASQSRVALIGSYRPPLGPVGELLDRAALHRAAIVTIRRWLRGASAAATTADHQEASAQARRAPEGTSKSLRAATDRPPPIEGFPAPG